ENLPCRVEKNPSNAGDKLSNARDELDTYKIQVKILSEKFERISGYYRSQLISHERKLMIMKALFTERHLHNLREEYASQRQKI
ncbi:hypothetical protein DBR06_SOUSAS5010040, partial [Sousa chinensis]